MKFEKFNSQKASKPKQTFGTELAQLNKGQAMRLKTAADYYLLSSWRTLVTKRTGKRFSVTRDGDDVLVYLKHNKK